MELWDWKRELRRVGEEMQKREQRTKHPQTFACFPLQFPEFTAIQELTWDVGCGKGCNLKLLYLVKQCLVRTAGFKNTTVFVDAVVVTNIGFVHLIYPTHINTSK